MAKHSWDSSLLAPSSSATTTNVSVRTLDEIVGNRPVDLLKVDVEGAEYDVLAAFTGLARVKAVAIEYDGRRSPAPLVQFLDLLRDFRLVRARGDSDSHLVIVGVR
jgi:hypothetical protein